MSDDGHTITEPGGGTAPAEGGDGLAKILPFPRDWFGPIDELVPVFPASAAVSGVSEPDAAQDPAGVGTARGEPKVPVGAPAGGKTTPAGPVSAASFWDEDAGSVHQLVESLDRRWVGDADPEDLNDDAVSPPSGRSQTMVAPKRARERRSRVPARLTRWLAALAALIVAVVVIGHGGLTQVEHLFGGAKVAHLADEHRADAHQPGAAVTQPTTVTVFSQAQAASKHGHGRTRSGPRTTASTRKRASGHGRGRAHVNGGTAAASGGSTALSGGSAPSSDGSAGSGAGSAASGSGSAGSGSGSASGGSAASQGSDASGASGCVQSPDSGCLP